MGKLGYPCALAAATKHDVVGYDVSPHAKEILRTRRYPHRELRAQDLLEETALRVVDTVDEAVRHAEIVFVAVQTPHQPRFEGTERMPEDRADFDYGSLREAVGQVAEAAARLEKRVTVAVISTVLPGTMRREIYPILNEWTLFAYSPLFIAMGETIPNYLNPEFVLLGVDANRTGGREAADAVREVYGTLIPNVKIEEMSVASAELCKVFYNVFLGQKIVVANALMEIAHKTGANCDEVTRALAKATDRVISPRYMRGGMGDGGACHPRDQIALSWLARKLDLSRDIFSDMILARESQTEWLADICCELAAKRKMGIVVLGKAYKSGTNLTIGSPATLLKNILDERDGAQVEQWDPHVDPPRVFSEPGVFIIATDHPEFYPEGALIRGVPKGTGWVRYPAGSVVVDPWGFMPDRLDVEVVRVGRA